MSAERDEILELVIQIGEEKADKGKDLIISGMEEVHPVYEAATALIRSNLTDQEIASSYAKDANSLRKVFLVDALLDRIPVNNKRTLVSMLSQGKSLDEVCDRAALDLSEGKRVRDGNVVSDPGVSLDDKYFRKAMAMESKRGEIYLSADLISRAKKSALSYKQKAHVGYWIKGFLAAALAGAIATGVYYKDRIEIDFRIKDSASINK